MNCNTARRIVNQIHAPFTDIRFFFGKGGRSEFESNPVRGHAGALLDRSIIMSLNLAVPPSKRLAQDHRVNNCVIQDKHA